jgi:hypothetical protein
MFFLNGSTGHPCTERSPKPSRGLVEAWRAQSEGAGAKVVVFIDTSLATP